jgi:hypothetical protein
MLVGAALVLSSSGMYLPVFSAETSIPTPNRVPALDYQPDEANFPNTEVSLAKGIWERWAYFNQSEFKWQPEYLSRTGLNDPLKTPEIDWYFPFFIEFCKEKDLLSYETVGSVKAETYMIEDFREFCKSRSPYNFGSDFTRDGDIQVNINWYTNEFKWVNCWYVEDKTLRDETDNFQHQLTENGKYLTIKKIPLLCCL